MAEYIEGKHPVQEALRTQVPATCLYLAEGLQNEKAVGALRKQAQRQDIPVKQVHRAFLDERSARGSHQGFMLEVKPFNYVSAHEIIQAANNHAEQNSGNALVVVLDHITDAGNLGAIARSVEVVGASGILIPSKRSARVTAATYKSSAGAISHVKVAQIGNVSQALDAFKEEGFWVAGASEHATQCIWDAPMAGKLVLVMGSEGEGIARLVQQHCDFLVALPQAGKVGSLNVAQAATACMYEWMRQARPV